MEQTETIIWIPCSERLPEFQNYYLVTYQGYEGSETFKVRQAFFREHDSQWIDHYNVIAWAKLPQGYKQDDKQEGK